MHTQIFLNTENKGLPISQTCEVKGCNKEGNYYFPIHERYTKLGFKIHSVCLKCKQTLDFLREIDKFFITMRNLIKWEFFKEFERGF